MAILPKKKTAESKLPHDLEAQKQEGLAPEIIATPEAGGEQMPDEGQKETASSKEIVAPPPPSMSQQAPAPALPKEPLLRDVENILSDGLLDVYKTLPADVQTEFKVEGERVASRIREMMKKARVKAREVLHLIRNWLKLIPGVNKFFLEQEAKIKTDRVIELAERGKGTRR